MPSLSLSLPAHAKLPPPPPLRPQKAINFDLLSNRLISHINVGHLRKAITTLDLMAQLGTHPDLPTYSLLLKSCIRSRNFDLLYSKSGDWKKANSIFENMGSERNLVSWSAMVSCFVNNDMGYEAISTFLHMLEHGLSIASHRSFGRV
ncbi:hypothetical protein ACFX13_046148 [Malus domestica]